MLEKLPEQSTNESRFASLQPVFCQFLLPTLEDLITRAVNKCLNIHLYCQNICQPFPIDKVSQSEIFYEH